jgi:hypothetical protein
MTADRKRLPARRLATTLAPHSLVWGLPTRPCRLTAVGLTLTPGRHGSRPPGGSS